LYESRPIPKSPLFTEPFFQLLKKWIVIFPVRPASLQSPSQSPPNLSHAEDPRQVAVLRVCCVPLCGAVLGAGLRVTGYWLLVTAYCLLVTAYCLQVINGHLAIHWNPFFQLLILPESCIDQLKNQSVLCESGALPLVGPRISLESCAQSRNRMCATLKRNAWSKKSMCTTPIQKSGGSY